MSHILSHSAKEIDEKLESIPPAPESEPEWTRAKAWQRIADQEYSPVSAYAQSGKAVAEAIADAVSKIEIPEITEITDEEIEALVNEVLLDEST